MNFINRVFHLTEKNTNTKNELLGGLLTFVAMVYILPTNAYIMSSMGMDRSGVFAITALVSALVTYIMSLVANYPIALSTGMGLNAYLVYTVSSQMGYSWQQSLILLSISGIIFFILSITSVRKKIIEAMPKDLRYIISACLGIFILFVGLRGSGIIVSDPAGTIVKLGTFADPGMFIGLACTILAIRITFSKHKLVSSLAIPIAVLSAAVVGLITSSIMIATKTIINVGDTWVYNTGFEFIDKCTVNLPIGPWYTNAKFGMEGVDKVFFFGMFDQSLKGTADAYSMSKFGNDILVVLKQPTTYVALFSLVFVNIFDTTATILALGNKVGAIDDEGRMVNYHKTILADSTGALICAPLGTSMVTSFAESNVGVSMGARTGLSSFVTASLFLLCAFTYPVFSIFTAGSVTCAALVNVGVIIIVGAVININKKDLIACYTAVIAMLFSLLTYSISNGIGIGIIVYCLSMITARRAKEVRIPVYIIGALYVASFICSTVVNFF